MESLSLNKIYSIVLQISNCFKKKCQSIGSSAFSVFDYAA